MVDGATVMTSREVAEALDAPRIQMESQCADARWKVSKSWEVCARFRPSMRRHRRLFLTQTQTIHFDAHDNRKWMLATRCSTDEKERRSTQQPPRGMALLAWGQNDHHSISWQVKSCILGHENLPDFFIFGAINR